MATFLKLLCTTLLFFAAEGVLSKENLCQRICTCSPIRDGGLKLDCSNRDIVISDNSTILNLPVEARDLDLSRNRINSFPHGVFEKLPNLQKLNLSNNYLKVLDDAWFDGLEKLRILSLSNNPIKSISADNLKSLPNLRYLEAGTSTLTCDCGILSFRRLIGNGRKRKPGIRRIVVSNDTICQFPLRLRGTLLARTQRSELSCGAHLKPVHFAVEPKALKFVIDGDSTSLTCNVSAMNDDETLEWLHEGVPLKFSSSDKIFDTHFSGDRRYHEAVLTIENFQPVDSGKWTCRLETRAGAAERHVHLSSIQSLNGSGCPHEVITDRKGTFMWPQTFRSLDRSVACPHNEGEKKQATRQCGANAVWEDPRTIDCDFISPIFRALSELQHAKFSASEDIDSYLMALKNATQTFMVPKRRRATAEDFNLVLQRVEKVAPIVQTKEQVELIFDIADDLLMNKLSTLATANKKFRTTRRLLNLFRSFSTLKLRSEFGLSECAVNANNENGVSALLFDGAAGRNFVCFLHNNIQENGIKISWHSFISIPINFSAEIRSSVSAIPVRFYWYRRAAALALTNREDFQDGWTADQAVLGVESNNFADVDAFLDNVNISTMVLRWRLTEKFVDWTEIKVAILSSNFAEGISQWKPLNACELLSARTQQISFSCPLTFGHFTLMRKSEKSDGLQQRISLPPWVLVACGFCVACLMTAACTYCCCLSQLKSSIKLRHALVNSWISMSILLLGFTVSDIALDYFCLAVAVLLHYCCLTVLLWFFIVARTLQRKLQKTVYPTRNDDDEDGEYEDGNKPRHGPLVGMYFLAWGVPAMPCAFTLALRKELYMDNKIICFLDSGLVSLIAVVLPAGAIVTVTFLLLFTGLRLRARSKKDNPGQRQNDTDEPLVSRTAEADVLSLTTTLIGDDAQVNLHTKSTLISFILFLVCHGLAVLFSLRTRQPFQRLPYFFEIVTSLFSTFVIFMGVYVLWCYVLGRTEVRKRWRELTVRKMEISTRENAENCRISNMNMDENSLNFRSTDRRKSNSENMINDSAISNHANRSIANAGTAVTRPPSRQSTTVASTTVSTCRSQKYQQAVAKKYFEKQRALKINASGDEFDQSVAVVQRRLANMESGGEEDFEGHSRKHQANSGNCEIANGGSTIFPDEFEPNNEENDTKSTFLEGNGENSLKKNRRAVVEIYKGRQSKEQRSGSEDSTPEALRNFNRDTKSKNKNSLKNETSV